MSSVWDMILQWGSAIKVSIELPVATRHDRDMNEKLVKAVLNPNKQQQQHNNLILQTLLFSDRELKKAKKQQQQQLDSQKEEDEEDKVPWLAEEEQRRSKKPEREEKVMQKGHLMTKPTKWLCPAKTQISLGIHLGCALDG